jgi:enoyl-[acyl-carrier protein] reductase I
MKTKNWSYILGGSSGIGLACAKALATKGYNLFLVHRDGRIATKSFLEQIEKLKTDTDVKIITLNANTNTKEGIQQIKDTLLQLEAKSVKIFIHSVADGYVKPIFSGENSLNEEDFLYTINSMGVSFVTWSQWLLKNNLFAENAKIYGFTSEGSKRVIPHYAAVGTAKAVLETLCRYMAVELAPHNISVNLLCPGVVNTKAIRVFPEVENFLEKVIQKNPYKRLTSPEDIANLIVALSNDNLSWLTGEIIHIDGGENNVF